MERATPVSWFVRLTDAPGTIEPDGSLISPVISASRRQFLTGALGAAAAVATRGAAFAQAAPRVVIVGGGFGGASVARWLKRTDPGIAVTLIERSPQFVACPFSNLVLGGLREMSSITFNYDGVKRAGVDVVQGEAVAVVAYNNGLATGHAPNDMAAFIHSKMYDPHY